MNLSTIVKNMLAEESKSLHFAFIAQILSVDDARAKIQPMGLIKNYGKEPQKQAPITNVPILDTAKYKLGAMQWEGTTIATLTPIKKGDLVLCVCCDRNIDAAIKGKNSLPPVGYHNKSDCVIVSIV